MNESYRVCRRPTFPEIRSIASQGNIEQNEIYMIFIMLSKSNEFGKKVRAGMAFVKSGNNCNEKLCYCALYSSRLMQNLEIQGVWRGKNTDMVLCAELCVVF